MLRHAYCMSVHKSQGNEFKIVIMSVLPEYSIMMKKNLLYTGITRAKQSLFILGDHNVFIRGLHNNQDEQRRSTLLKRFQERHKTSSFRYLTSNNQVNSSLKTLNLSYFCKVLYINLRLF